MTYPFKTLKILIYVFDWFYIIQNLTSFSSLDRRSLLYAFLNTVSFKIILINPFNVFMFADVNIYQKDCFIHSCETDRPGELYIIFS